MTPEEEKKLRLEAIALAEKVIADLRAEVLSTKITRKKPKQKKLDL